MVEEFKVYDEYSQRYECFSYLDDLEPDTTSTTVPRIPTDMTVVPVCTTFQAESNGTSLIKIVQAVFEIRRLYFHEYVSMYNF
jgi:hypothetical protein